LEDQRVPDVSSIAPGDVPLWVALDVHKLSIVAATLPTAGADTPARPCASIATEPTTYATTLTTTARPRSEKSGPRSANGPNDPV
jgi:hypothetical protein